MMTTKTTRRSGMRWTAGIIGARAEKSGCSGSAMSVVLLLAFCRLAVGQLPTQGAVVLRIESQKRQELYQKMDCDASSFSAEVGPKSTTNTTPSNNNTQVRLDTRHACMCGFLKSLAPAETQLRSQKSGTVAAAAAKCVNGVATIPGTSRQYACSKINLQSFVSLVELNDLYGSPTDRTSDVWGWTDPKSCREFALLGMESGLAIVEITNPFDYTYTGKLPPHDEDSFWRNVKTYRNHAFVVSESPRHGMQIFDLKQLLNLPQDRNVLSETYHYNGFGNAHTMIINEETGFAYAAGTNTCEGGLHMIDIRTPSEPKFLGCFGLDGYTHDLQCVVYRGSDTNYKGREICLGCNENTVTIVDVTDKASPVLLSKTTYVAVGYTHQGWLTDDHNYFIFGDEFDEGNGSNTKTLVLNLGSNLKKPVIGGSHLSKLKVTDHNQYIIGNRIFQANYQAGLRILRINNAVKANFTEVAFFDTYPSGNENSYNGAWSNYPFFPSGNIVVSGIEQGLFVLRPTLSTNMPTTAMSCPARDKCFDDPSLSQCGGFAPRHAMSRLLLGVCVNECVPNAIIARKKANGWECGKCP